MSYFVLSTEYSSLEYRVNEYIDRDKKWVSTVPMSGQLIIVDCTPLLYGLC